MLAAEHADAIQRFAPDGTFAALAGIALPPPSDAGRGYGTFAVRLTLELAFRNLQLARVYVRPPGGDIAAGRTLQKFGFNREGESGVAEPNVATGWVLTRDAWIVHRDRPVFAALHPDLRAILEAELAAGNEVADGVVYTEPNDPHWWKADYTSRSPRHTLAC